MDVPFPTDQVTLRFTELNVTKGICWKLRRQAHSPVARSRSFPRHDQHALMTSHYSPGNEKRLAEIMAHEVAHYYWHHQAIWINEGMAETLTSYIENERVDTPIALSNPPCSTYRSIIELEIDAPKKSEFSKYLDATTAWDNHCSWTCATSLEIKSLYNQSADYTKREPRHTSNQSNLRSQTQVKRERSSTSTTTEMPTHRASSHPTSSQ